MDTLFTQFLGVILGAALTYAITTRHYRRERLTSMFDHAKGAVFAEDASRQIPNHVAVDALNLTSNDADELAIQLRREGFLQFVRAAGEARAALAQITPRCPDLLPYTKQFEIPPEEVGAVIEILENAQIAATASPIHRWRRKPSR